MTRHPHRRHGWCLRIGGVRVRRYGAYWCADGCAETARTPEAAAWIATFLNG